MDRRRFLQLTTSHAVARGEPLHDALNRAVASLGMLHEAEGAALLDARTGDLDGALGHLGFEPVVREAARVEPTALAAVDARLTTVPSISDLSWRYRIVILYLSLLAAAQAVVGMAIQGSVMPALSAIGSEPILHPALSAPAAALVPAAVLWAAAAIWGTVGITGVVVAISGARFAGLGGGIAAHLAQARLCLSAATLLEHRAPLAEVTGLLQRLGPAGGLDGLGASYRDAQTLVTLAGHSIARARRGADDLARRWKIAGTLACLVVAGFYTFSIYGALAGLSSGG